MIITISMHYIKVFLFGQAFHNLNVDKTNYPYVDLISEDGSILIQVSLNILLLMELLDLVNLLYARSYCKIMSICII